MNPQVPLPYVAPLPPHTPWWEIILIVLAIGSVILYASSLATSWWPSRKRSNKNRRFSRLWGWTMPAMLILVLGLAFVDTRWQDHRKDLEWARWDDVEAASAQVTDALGIANGVTIEKVDLDVVMRSTSHGEYVNATLTNGTEVYCRLNVVTKDGQRFAQLDVTSCHEKSDPGPVPSDVPWAD